MATKRKSSQRKLQKRRPLSYPIVMYRTPDGKLHPECSSCSGDGHPYRWTRRSDEPGTEHGHMMARTKCRQCGGLGYEKYNVAKVIDVAKGERAPHVDIGALV